MITSLLKKFRSNVFQNTLLTGILGAHLVFILCILLSPSFLHRKKEHKHLIVKTITPKPIAKTLPLTKKATAPAASKTIAPAPKPAIKKEIIPPKPQPIQKKETPAQKPAEKKDPAIADKKIAPAKLPVKNPPTAANRAKISDSLLQDLEESIAKIDLKSDKSAVKRDAKALAPLALQIDAWTSDEADETGDYTDLLIGHLHRLLSLPEYGEVKIQLSLRQDGSVAKVVVLKAQSEKNKHYLESNLALLRFPRFEGQYANKKEHTFTLTFCNEL